MPWAKLQEDANIYQLNPVHSKGNNHLSRDSSLIDSPLKEIEEKDLSNRENFSWLDRKLGEAHREHKIRSESPYGP